MEVYEGYRFFRRHGGWIVKANLDEGHNGTTHIVEGGQYDRLNDVFNPYIEINKNDSLEEQVRTLIHELIHLAPEYLGYAARGEELPSGLEEEIERKTLDIYEKEPLFVWYFRKLVEEAEEEKPAVYAA